MTSSSTYASLASATSSEDLLRQLKDLKNSVIGNTWKKVDVAEDEHLLAFLLSLLELPRTSKAGEADTKVAFELVSETAVIVGALANVGTLTLRPLLAAHAPVHLLDLITALASSTSSAQVTRVLPALLRALRNMLISTADVIWGHMWGVGTEPKVVGTGLVGDLSCTVESTVGVSEERKGKGVPGRSGWRMEASRALGLVFQPARLDTLLSLLITQTDAQMLLPLYQLLAKLVALPSHREALASWRPASNFDRDPGPSAFRSSPGPAARVPFIIHSLLSTAISPSITDNSHGASMGSRKPNYKLIEAALELLAALIQGQASLATAVRSWHPDTSYFPGSLYSSIEQGDEVAEYTSSSRQEVVSDLMTMAVKGPTSVRIAAASCLTNIIKADQVTRTSDKIRSTVVGLQLLDETIKLLQTEGIEDRVKLCFILSALVADDATLQKSAAEKGCPAQLVSILVSVDQEEDRGEMGSDVASRTREGALLALASLAMQYDPTRIFISDTNPSISPIILRSLSHQSYGVRAAGCQLARALSRAISLLRTTLSDSGIGEEVIRLLKREIEMRKQEDDEDDNLIIGGDRIWTVEVAATATICNLIADFSPLKLKLLSDGGVEMLCELTKSPYEPVALNALWAIKNLTFHSMESTKFQVMVLFGWNRLRSLLSLSTRISLRTQAFEILQNLLANASQNEITRTVDNLGESDLLDLVTIAAKDSDLNLTIPVLYVLSNLALGNDRLRQSIVARVEILEILSEALNSPSDPLKVPSLRCLRHLIESNSKNHRPRQGMIDLFNPYQLKPRLKVLAESSASLDVCQASICLLDVLDRDRDRDSRRG